MWGGSASDEIPPVSPWVTLIMLILLAGVFALVSV